jgi:hypothetical protein
MRRQNIIQSSDLGIGIQVHSTLPWVHNKDPQQAPGFSGFWLSTFRGTDIGTLCSQSLVNLHGDLVDVKKTCAVNELK